ncbi:MAG: LysM peptidoglycan-binding domain-containing protein [Actinomycetia bacterium]|nr:LysM peptidoglycan-binding domain-containing protein [Actinomycetes bacterium]MCH9801958.1 LysM peptidoglycan-binding domain-containing protein [Actinomycetes bacterium]
MSATTPSAFTVPASPATARPAISRSWTLVGHWFVALTVVAGVITGLIAAVALAVPVLAQAADQAAASEAVRSGDGAVVLPQPALREYRVLPGDTIWSLAVASSSADPRETVDRIMELNGLASPSLQVGEAIVLPNG